MRITTALNRLLRLRGASVIDVSISISMAIILGLSVSEPEVARIVVELGGDPHGI